MGKPLKKKVSASGKKKKLSGKDTRGGFLRWCSCSTIKKNTIEHEKNVNNHCEGVRR